MSSATKVKEVSALRFPREIAPRSHRVWQTQNEDVMSSLQSLFTAWLNDVSENEMLFKQYVYENNDLNEGDLRQHRILLYNLLCNGEDLAFRYLTFAQGASKLDEVKPIVEVIDNKLKELFTALNSWHGPLSAQADIPDSFKKACEEADKHHFVNLEFKPNAGEGK